MSATRHVRFGGGAWFSGCAVVAASFGASADSGAGFGTKSGWRCIKPGRHRFDTSNLLQIRLVVDAVAQHVSELAQCALQSVRGALLLGLFVRGGLALAVVDLPKPDVLVICAIAERDPHYHGDAQADLLRLRVDVLEVYMDVLDGGRPAIEPKDLVGEVDAFVGRDILQADAARAAAGREVFRTELLVESGLESGNLLGRKLRYPLWLIHVGIGDVGVLIPRPR
jgi:hypothetical protein